MNPNIALAVAGMSVGLTTAILAANGVFKGHIEWAYLSGGLAVVMLLIALFNWRTQRHEEPPDVALVWDWTPEEKGRQSFLGNTEKSIFVDNRNDQTIGRVCIDPIPLHCSLTFDEINEIPPKSRGLAVGRWNIASENKSTTIDGYHQYMQTFDDGLQEKGWEKKKPHNRGMSSTFAKIPMAVIFDWQNATWKVKFSWHYDARDDEIYFDRGRTKKVRHRSAPCA
jgi:hypothetical protein